jgi:protein TonB
MIARLLPLVLVALAALPAQAQVSDVFNVVDDPPQLIGGLEGLAQQVQYPEAAKAAGTEGTVVVQFVVSERGDVVDEEVVRSVSPELDAEALRVVRQARFEPGTHHGEPVKVQFALPIQFRLDSDRADR